MGYAFLPGRRYRMPTHFGPALGPRHHPDPEKSYGGPDYLDAAMATAVFEADPGQLERFLPPGFELRAPHTLNFSFSYFTDISWLAGRAYNTFGVTTPVRYRGREDNVAGGLLLVLWENMADPIITGREDLGFSKIYCELPEKQFLGDRLKCRAAWDGCEFATMELNGLAEAGPDAMPADPESEGVLHYKYIPATGSVGEADVEYATFSPAAMDGMSLKKFMAADTAAISFRKSTWEELPTLVHIVNALAELDIGKCLGAAYVEARGGKDLSDQRRLR